MLGLGYLPAPLRAEEFLRWIAPDGVARVVAFTLVQDEESSRSVLVPPGWRRWHSALLFWFGAVAALALRFRWSAIILSELF